MHCALVLSSFFELYDRVRSSASSLAAEGSFSVLPSALKKRIGTARFTNSVRRMPFLRAGFRSRNAPKSLNYYVFL